MTDHNAQTDNTAPSPETALNRKISQAGWAILATRLWLALWPPAAVALAFASASLFKLWALLPPDWHRGALIAFAALGAASLLPLLRLRWPTREEAVERLQQESGLSHRPIASYEDSLTLSADDPRAQILWRAHRARLAALFARLRAGWPRPRIDRKDPFALRTPLILLFCLGLAAHGDEFRQRLVAAFDVKASTAGPGVRIDAWITPPAYTGKAPLMLADGQRFFTAFDLAALNAIEAPEGSEFIARVNHPRAWTFAVSFRPDGAAEAEMLTPAAESGETGLAEFKASLAQSGVISIIWDGETMARWRVSVIDDRAPSIALAKPLKQAQRGSLHIKYRVEDDYGVASARAMIKASPEDPSIRGDDPDDGDRLGEPPVIQLALPRPNMKSGEGQTFRDLTSHPWAGLPVSMTLVAEDQAGQIAGVDAGRFILPERNFQKPLARALIEQRKRLVSRPSDPAPVVLALEALTFAPEIFIENLGVYLGLRSVVWRLRLEDDIAAVESAVEQLWQIALRIEEGDLSDAERELRAAQERLQRALEQGASEEELQKLVDELRQALNKFLEAMQQNALKDGQPPPADQRPGDQVTQQELDKMLNKIEDLARTGSREAAQQLLNELQQMLENAQAGRQQNRSGQAQQMMERIDQLSGMMTQQQELLDDTYEARRREEDGAGQQGPQGEGRPQGRRERGEGDSAEPPSLEELRERQQALQRRLEEFRQSMPGGGDAEAERRLGEAAEAMEEAERALREGDGERATQQQSTAVERLRQGARAMAEQMMQAMRPGEQGQGGREGGDAQRDPLGRPNRSDGAEYGDDVEVPDEIDIQRAREILDELRRRMGERFRPRIELDYFDRLIKRF